jgi:hypothetical protein
MTVDQSYVLVSTAFDRRSTYVAMTRHREGLQVYYAQDTLKDLVAAQKVMGRARSKSLALSYMDAERRNEVLQATRQRRAAQSSSTLRPETSSGRLQTSGWSINDVIAAPKAPPGTASSDTLPPEARFVSTEEGRQVTNSQRFAEATRAFWLQQAVRLKRAHPILAKLGLLGIYRVKDPVTAKAMRLQEGLKRSEKLQEVAQEDHKRAWARFEAVVPATERASSTASRPDFASERETPRAHPQQDLKPLPRMEGSTPLSFEQALRDVPEVKAVTRRLEEAIRQARKLRGPSEARAASSSSQIESLSSSTAKQPDELEGALRDVRAAKRELKEVLGRPWVQQEASQRASGARDLFERSRAKEADMMPCIPQEQEQRTTLVRRPPRRDLEQPFELGR